MCVCHSFRMFRFDYSYRNCSLLSCYLVYSLRDELLCSRVYTSLFLACARTHLASCLIFLLKQKLSFVVINTSSIFLHFFSLLLLLSLSSLILPSHAVFFIPERVLYYFRLSISSISCASIFRFFLSSLLSPRKEPRKQNVTGSLLY